MCESRRCQPRTKAGRLVGIAKTRPPPPSFTDRGRPRRPVRRVLSTVESLTVKLAEAWQSQSFLTYANNTPAADYRPRLRLRNHDRAKKNPRRAVCAPDGGWRAHRFDAAELSLLKPKKKKTVVCVSRSSGSILTRSSHDNLLPSA